MRTFYNRKNNIKTVRSGKYLLLLLIVLFCLNGRLFADVPESWKRVTCSHDFSYSQIDVSGVNHIVKGFSPNELKSYIANSGLQLITYPFLYKAPGYFALLTGAVAKLGAIKPATAMALSAEFSQGIHFLMLFNTLRFVRDTVLWGGEEALNLGLDTWGQNLASFRCAERVGSYPVFLEHKGLSRSFMFRVELNEEGPASLSIQRLSGQVGELPDHWRRLARTMDQEKVQVVRLSIDKEHLSLVVQNSGQGMQRKVALADGGLDWDINLMGRWCTHQHNRFYSIFHPLMIQTVSYLLTASHVDSVMSPPPVVSGETLWQSSVASVYDIGGGEDTFWMVWSDITQTASLPGFLSLGSASDDPQGLLGMASSSQARFIFSSHSYQDSWTRQDLALLSLLLNAQIRQWSDEAHTSAIKSGANVVARIKPVLSTSIDSVRMPSFEAVKSTVVSWFDPLRRELRLSRPQPGTLQPLHLTLWHTLMPIRLLGPMYMVDPDDVDHGGGGSDSNGKRSSVKDRRMAVSAPKPVVTKKDSLLSSGSSVTVGSPDSGGGESRHSSLVSDRSNSASRSWSQSSLLRATTSTPDLMHKTMVPYQELLFYADLTEAQYSQIVEWLELGVHEDNLPTSLSYIQLIRAHISYVDRLMAELHDAVKAPEGFELTELEKDGAKPFLSAHALALEALREGLKTMTSGVVVSVDSESVVEARKVIQWLGQLKATLSIQWEMMVPPRIISEVVPEHGKSDSPDTVDSLYQQIAEFTRVLGDTQQKLLHIWQNPDEAKGVVADFRWLSLCKRYMSDCEKLILEVNEAATDQSMLSVNGVLVRKWLDEMRLLFSGGRMKFEDRLIGKLPASAPVSLMSDSFEADRILLVDILTGMPDVPWWQADSARNARIIDVLAEDLEGLGQKLARVSGKLPKLSLGSPQAKRMDALIASLTDSRSKWVDRLGVVQQWNKMGYLSTHSRIVTMKGVDLDGTRKDRYVQVDIYEPHIAQLAVLYHEVISSCRLWRTGCPPLETLFPQFVMHYLKDISSTASAVSDQSEAVSTRVMAFGEDVMGGRYKRYKGLMRLMSGLTGRLTQQLEQLGQYKGRQLMESALMPSILHLEDEMNGLYEGLGSIGLSRKGESGWEMLTTENLWSTLIDDASEFRPEVGAIEGRLRSGGGEVAEHQVTMFVQEVRRLTQLTLMSQSGVDNNLVILRRNVEGLDHLRSLRSENQWELKALVSFLEGQKPPYQEEELAVESHGEFTLQRFDELKALYPDSVKMPESWAEKSHRPLRPTASIGESVEKSLKALQSSLEETSGRLGHEKKLWNVLVRTSARLDSSSHIHYWQPDYRVSASPLPDEKRGLPFPEEIIALWKSPTDRSAEYTFDTGTPLVMSSKPSGVVCHEAGCMTEVDEGGFAVFERRTEQARSRSQGGINVYGEVNAWTRSIDTVLTDFQGSIGEKAVTPYEDSSHPSFHVPLIGFEVSPTTNVAVQSDLPPLGRELRRDKIFHVDHQFIGSLARDIVDLLASHEQDLSRRVSSLPFMTRKQDIEATKQDVKSAEKKLTEVRELWRKELPSLESLLKRPSK